MFSLNLSNMRSLVVVNNDDVCGIQSIAQTDRDRLDFREERKGIRNKYHAK